MSISIAIRQAKTALERGDYNQCLNFLEPLSKEYPLGSKEGAEIRMLMITAWMGRGNEQKAIATCKLLSKVTDPDIRQQAKQLISILEAPSLPRPENWSIEIPNINFKQNIFYTKTFLWVFKPLFIFITGLLYIQKQPSLQNLMRKGMLSAQNQL